MRSSRQWQLILGPLLAGIFLWLTLRTLNPANASRVLDGANAGLVIAGLAMVMLGYFCRIERWRLMLASTNPRVRWRDCAGPLLASFAANNLLPLRAGDVMRSFAFNSELGASSGVVLATVFVERLLDFLVLLIFLASMLLAFGPAASSVMGASGGLMAIAVIVLVILLFPRLTRPAARASGNLAIRWSAKFGRRIAEEIDRCVATLEELAAGRRVVGLLAWSMVAWAVEGTAYFLTALSMAGLSNPEASWLALPVTALATLVPSAPGYIGTFDFFAVQAMTAGGNDPHIGTVYAFLVHTVIWLPPTISGGGYLLLRQLNQGDVRAR